LETLEWKFIIVVEPAAIPAVVKVHRPRNFQQQIIRSNNFPNKHGFKNFVDEYDFTKYNVCD
jgi:hypothetical protein